MYKIKPGKVIQSDNWSEPLIVDSVGEMYGHIRITGSLAKSGNHIDELISEKEFEEMVKITIYSGG